ncbi:hypothetical protein [Streptomyces sp. NPDC058279]|uniref:hypothetical protein n=1 Tax=Streptomyces sp. NPDC058279 TaxID=3346418 RepID=UPI0036E47AD6
MSMPEGGESAGGESGREPGGHPDPTPAVPAEPTPAGRRFASALRAAAVLAPVPAEAVVAHWVPEWSEVAGGLLRAAKALVTLRRGRGGQPRG